MESPGLSTGRIIRPTIETMKPRSFALQFAVLTVVGWTGRQQQLVIDYLLGDLDKRRLGREARVPQRAPRPVGDVGEQSFPSLEIVR
jgi:hypothetical protein